MDVNQTRQQKDSIGNNEDIQDSDFLNTNPKRIVLYIPFIIASFFGLYLISRYNYLLFHCLAEFFAIVVAFSLFLLIWSGRKYIKNSSLVFLGSAYLFVGLIDLLHTLAYKGMGVFPDIADANHATQLWIAARGLEVFSLFIFTFLLGKRTNVKVYKYMALFSVITAALISSIFLFQIFPDCFVEGSGLTAFKKGSEYFLCLILFINIIYLSSKREYLFPYIFYLMLGSLITTIIAELFFTFYIDVFGMSNQIGHFLKIVSFFLIYMALIRSGLTSPYALMFHEMEQDSKALKESEEKFRELFERMSSGVAIYEPVDRGEDFIFKEFNRAGEIIEKVNRQNIIGRRVSEVFPGVKEFGIFDVLKRVHKTGKPEFFPETMYKDERDPGSWRESQVFNLSSGEIVTVYEDVTESKLAEEKLKNNERILDQTGQMAKVGGWEHDLETGEATWTRALYDIIEIDPSERPPGTKEHLNYYPPKDREILDQALKNAVEKNESFDLELQVSTAKGRLLWCRVYGEAVFDNGKCVKLRGSFQEINNIKLAEQDLRTSESKWRSYLESSPFGVFVTDKTGRYIEVNPAASSITGYDESELLSMSIPDMIPRESHQESAEHFKRLVEKGESFGEVRFVHKSGEIRWWSVSAVRISDDRFLGFVEDITERKTADETMRESERRVRAKLDSLLLPEGDIGELSLADIIDVEAIQTLMDNFYNLTNIGIAILDLAGNALVVKGWQDICTKFHRVHPETNRNCIESDLQLSKGIGPGAYKIYKCKNNMLDMATPIQVGGKHVGNLYLGQFLFDDEEPDYDFFRRQAREYGFNEREYLAALDKVPRWSRETVDAAMTFYTQFASLISKLSYSNIKLARTLEGRRQAERALVENEEKYRYLYDSMAQGVTLQDDQGKIVEANQAACRILGLSMDQMMGKTSYDPRWKLTREDGSPYDPAEMPSEIALRTGKPALDVSCGIYLPEEDAYRWILISSVPKFKKGEEKPYLTMTVFTDITRIKQMEEELLKTQKLESIGVLAGGIAHDFNNLLTAIVGNISLAKMDIDPQAETFELLEESETACERAAALTQQLLTFSKGGTPIKKVASITKLLKESATFALRGSNVRCEFKFDEDIWPVPIDTGQMNQVINNLAINADQAMPEGGTLEIAAENILVEKGQFATIGPGKYVKATIKDQGHGIIESYLTKIFDPFFTTKEKGSGLGLATSHSIAQKHGGLLTVDSVVGKGTTFTIYLPAKADDELANEKAKAKEKINLKGFRLLIMDDEDGVRKTASRALKRMGCETKEAADGKEAIKLFKAAHEAGKPFDAVILDLTIPGGMGGKEVIIELNKIDPEVKAIVASGYSNAPVLANFADYGFKAMLAKPFTAEALTKAVGTTLGLMSED